MGSQMCARHLNHCHRLGGLCHFSHSTTRATQEQVEVYLSADGWSAKADTWALHIHAL
jgi:hypothetical protein